MSASKFHSHWIDAVGHKRRDNYSQKKEKRKKKKAKIPNSREDQIDSINLGGIIQLPVQLTT